MSEDTPITNADGETPGLFQTFIGAGFGTVQIERAVGNEPAPAAVSGRRYLRDNLPGIYSEGDFGMRLVSGFEALLDPLVAALDNLPEHFDPVYAPRDVLDLLTEWLGLEHDEAKAPVVEPPVVEPEPFGRHGGMAVDQTLHAAPGHAGTVAACCNQPHARHCGRRQRRDLADAARIGTRTRRR